MARRSLTSAFSSAASASDGDAATTNALIASPLTSSGIPITAASDNGRVADEALLDLARADAVAGARDQVVGSADEWK